MIKDSTRGVAAGFMIAVGGVVYLSVENTVAGALLFALGLLTVCCFGLNLFTGKVGYCVENKPKYLLFLLNIWFGNLIGAVAVGVLVRLTRIVSISQRASAICSIKLDDSPLSIFILSVFCGILMFVAVDCYKRFDGFGKYIAVFMCVAVFILSGFEHCVANMFYFTVADAWSLKTVLYLIIMTLGNSLGGILIPLINKIK